MQNDELLDLHKYEWHLMCNVVFHGIAVKHLLLLSLSHSIFLELFITVGIVGMFHTFNIFFISFTYFYYKLFSTIIFISLERSKSMNLIVLSHVLIQYIFSTSQKCTLKM